MHFLSPNLVEMAREVTNGTAQALVMRKKSLDGGNVGEASNGHSPAQRVAR
jgi:hypothetical protein